MIQTLNRIFESTEAIIEAIFDFLISLVPSSNKTEYDAHFIPASDILSSYNKGFCLTGQKCLSLESSTKNALVIGSTGNFKSSGILIPSILRMRGHASLVINDPSGELLLKSSGALIQAGYVVKSINYCSPSEGYNPLARTKNREANYQKISKMIVGNSLGHNSKDPFFNLSSESLISLMTKLVMYQPQEYHSLYNVYHLVSVLAYAPEKIDLLIVRTQDTALLSEYRAFLSYGDRTLSSVIATCRAALALFGTDSSVALTTSCDTLDLAAFRKQKHALFINTGTQDMRYYSLVTSLFLEQCFGEIMDHLPVKGDLPVYFLIDEASSLYFNSLQITISNIRKFDAGILQIYQSASQIIDLYGQAVAKAITENSYARVYMSGQPISVSQELETTLGKFEYRDEKEVRHIRPLMTADEIRQIDESIILCGNSPAIKAPIVPYFRQPKLQRLTAIAPYVPQIMIPYSSPPLIPLD